MSFVEQQSGPGLAGHETPDLSVRPGSDIQVIPGPNDVIVLTDDGAYIEPGVTYKVHTETFEGPFDLLLHLILKEEVELYDINLSEIVDAYLAELEQMDMCDLETSTEFLLIAATLVELKVRRLMPVDEEFDLDAELGLWEERDLLLARLLECKTFKDAAKTLDWMMDVAALVVPRRAGLEDQFLEIAPDLLAGITPEKLRRAFLRVASAKPELKQMTLFHVTDVKASVADSIGKFMSELPGAGPQTFRQLTLGLAEKLEVVVRFLAVLELYKQGYVEIDQHGAFGDLTVEWVDDESQWASADLNFDAYEG